MSTTSNRLVRRCISASIVALLAVLVTACSPELQARLRRNAAVSAPTTPTERQFINGINQFRASHGLRALSVQPNLQNKARSWAAEMAAGHCGRSAQGVPTICHSNLASGITVHWTRLEENVGYASPRNSVNALTIAFERSPEHAANMLNAKITEVGIGVAYFGNFLYVSEEFMAS